MVLSSGCSPRFPILDTLLGFVYWILLKVSFTGYSFRFYILDTLLGFVFGILSSIGFINWILS